MSVPPQPRQRIPTYNFEVAIAEVYISSFIFTTQSVPPGRPGTPIDLTDNTFSVVIGLVEPLTLTIGDGLTLDGPNGILTMRLEEAQTTAPSLITPHWYMRRVDESGDPTFPQNGTVTFVQP